MGISVRKAVPADLPAVLALLDSARGMGLPASERIKTGFIQGRWDARKLALLEAGTGIFLAEENNELAGVAITSGTERLDEGPPRLTLASALASGLDDETEKILFYGPVAIGRKFRGRGIMRILLAAIDESLHHQFSRAVLFVEDTNEKSISVHRHLGMREQAKFTFHERNYTVFSFPLRSFAS